METDGGKFVYQTVTRLVDDPDKVQVKEVIGTQAVLLEVSVKPTDIPRVIGRRGRLAEAIRQVLAGIGGREGVRYQLEILEPPRG